MRKFWSRFQDAALTCFLDVVVQVFPKLGPDTKLLLVPPTYGSHNPCTAGKPTVWCTNQTYDQWLAINRGNFVRPQTPELRDQSHFKLDSSSPYLI